VVTDHGAKTIARFLKDDIIYRLKFPNLYWLIMVESG
jgi:hypothetical protein